MDGGVERGMLNDGLGSIVAGTAPDRERQLPVHSRHSVTYDECLLWVATSLLQCSTGRSAIREMILYT